jgi:hypothetical protein
MKSVLALDLPHSSLPSFRAVCGPASRVKGRMCVRIIVVQDLDPERVASYPVARYVWAVLKVRALSQELGRAVLEVEQHETALASLRQGETFWAEAQAFLKQLESEPNDAHRRSWGLHGASLRSWPTTVETGPLTPNGSRLTVACPCGVTFERWITPEEAARDLAMLARWN